MVSEYGGDADGGVAAEVAMRFGRSGQPDSQQVVAVLKAITDVIRAEGLPVSPTSYFAAIMSALEKPDTQASQQVSLAMLTLLSVVLPRVPAHVLRSKFAGAAQLLGALLAAHKEEAAAAKAALGCLAAVLAAADPSSSSGASSWLAAVPGFNALLVFVTDARPKVRKRAVGGLVEVLAGLQRAPGALGPASDLVLKACQRVLPGPAAAAHAAAAASNKQRAAAEAAITAAVADALHLLGALKQALPLLAPAAAKAVTELMLKLYSLKQPLLDRHVTEALAALAGAGGAGGLGAGAGAGGAGGGAAASRLAASDLADLITVVLETESLWAAGPGRDPGLLTALGRLLEAGFGRLAEADPAAAAARLPRAVHALVPGLAAEQDGVRFGTSQALRSLILDSLTADVAAAARRPRGAAGPAPLSSLVAAVAGSLSSRYQDAWGMALPVVGALIERLGALGAAEAAAPLLVPLGAIVSGAVDAADDADAAAAAAGDATAAAGGAAATAAAAAAAAAHSGAAEATLGVAIKCLGPEIVLKVLPLQITEALAGGPEPRTWLLPLLRRHVRHARLGFWFKELMPLAQQLGARAAALSAAGGAAAGGLALKCRTLELQIWHCLPAFISWATDLPAAYAAGVNSLAAAFANRPDLQPAICAALARACMQVRHVLAAAGRGPEHVGHADPAAHGPASGAGSGGGSGGAGGGDDDDDDDAHLAATPEDAATAAAHGGAPPEGYGEEAAEAALGALRAFNAKWLSVLCAAYLAAGPEARAPFAAAIAAAAAVTPEAAVAGYFRAALQKLTKLIVDEAADVPPPDPVTEGGGDPGARRSAFLELALWLSYGLGDNAVDALFKAVKSALVHPEPGVQKRGFKVLAVLCEARSPWLAKNLKEVLKQLLGPSAVTTLSAARRHRLRLIRPVVVALQRAGDDCEALSSDVLGVEDQVMEGGEEEAAARTAGGRRRQLVASLVADIVLCTKEANMKTRAAAYDLLVGLAHLMDQADPGPGLARLRAGGGSGRRRRRAPGSGGMGGSSDDGEEDEDDEDEEAGGSGDMEEEDGGAGTSGKGGLYEFFSMVMAGLVATTPHMVSATVMALARLTFEFAAAMQHVVAALLPPVLSLLRGKAREIIKAVLGFVKVCAMRLPVELLQPQLGPILEGMLMWAEDSKNKFKLKVRVIVERLARRCGFDAVAAVMPAGDAKLLAHIRKEAAKKQRRKAGAGSEAGSEAGDEDGRSRRSAGRSSMARTARASQWGETAVFSSEDGGSEGAGGAAGGRGGPKSVKSAGGPRSVAGRSAAQQRRGGAGAAGAGGVRLAAGGGDPLDLLDASASRQLVRSAAGVRPAGAGGGAGEPAFTRDPATGKMVIAEEQDGDGEGGGAGRKRRRGRDASGYDSDDSDFDDLKGVADLKYAMKKAGESKSVRFAEARSQGGRSMGGRSAGGRSEGGRSMGGRSAGGRSEGGRSTASRGGKSAHSGDRFKAKGAQGDVKGKSKVDPYAYWTLDRRMLNRRRGKQAAASAKLESIVGGAQAGALKGAKAKRARDGQGAAKRQRTMPGSVE